MHFKKTFKLKCVKVKLIRTDNPSNFSKRISGVFTFQAIITSDDNTLGTFEGFYSNWS